MLEALARPNQADLDEFRAGIDPLASKNKLGALLAQFPASFKDRTTSRDYLAQLLRALSGYSVAVNFDTLAGATTSARRWRYSTTTPPPGSRLTNRVPVFDPPELPAKCQRLLLHAAARPQCEELVASRKG